MSRNGKFKIPIAPSGTMSDKDVLSGVPERAALAPKVS